MRLGCSVVRRAKLLNSWPRSESSNPGNRVLCAFCLSCFLFFFFSFQLLAFFLFTFTFIKLVKPIRHHTNSVFKQYITREKKHIFNDLDSSNKQGRCEETRKSVKETKRGSPLHLILVDYGLMFDSRRSFSLEYSFTGAFKIPRIVASPTSRSASVFYPLALL